MSRRNLSADDIRLVGQLADLQTKKRELEQRIQLLETKLQLASEAISALSEDEQELAEVLQDKGINCDNVSQQTGSTSVPRRGVELTTDLSSQLFGGFSQPGNFPQQTSKSYNFPRPAVPQETKQSVRPKAKAQPMPSLSVRRRPQ